MAIQADYRAGPQKSNAFGERGYAGFERASEISA
jgi:hypothetical protein